MKHPRIRVVALSALSSALIAIAFAATAIGHSAAGEMEILTLGQKGESTIIIEVGLVFEDDGHIAEEATVTATVRGPGGPYSTELERVGDGSRYSGTVDVDQPGEFRVVVESENPAAKARGDVVIEASTEAETEDPPVSPAEPEEPAVQENPRPDGDTEVEQEEADGGTPWALIGIAGLLLINGIVIGYWLYTRNKAGGAGGADRTDGTGGTGDPQ